MYTCEFCGIEFDDEGFGDLDPLCDEGFCCESCYYLFVIPARISQMNSQSDTPDEDNEYSYDDEEIDLPDDYYPGSMLTSY